MKNTYYIILLTLLIFSCNENSIEPILDENSLKFLTDKEFYNLNDPWLAKIINNTDSTFFITACGSISFGILRQVDTENSWKEIKSINQPCLAIYLLYYELTPKDTAIILGPTPYINKIITESGRYKFYTEYSNSLNIENVDTLFSNIFEVK